MIFLSMDKGLEFVAQPMRYKYHNMADGSVDKQEIPGKFIRFSPLTTKMEWPLSPVHGRTKAEGIFNSESTRARPNMTKEEAENFLLDHRFYGVTMIGYGANGKVYGTGEDAIPEDRIIVLSGDGYFCKICKQQLASRGRHNHPKSKQHQRLLDGLERDGIEKLLEDTTVPSESV
jgi:hypothetical protein